MVALNKLQSYKYNVALAPPPTDEMNLKSCYHRIQLGWQRVQLIVRGVGRRKATELLHLAL